MRRVAVAIFKGGTGKSTVAVNVGVGLARRGKRVLVIDLDAQANASHMLGAADAAPTIREVLVDRLAPEQAVRPVEANLGVLPASRSLAPIEAWLTTQVRREEVLRQRLEALAPRDVVILDCAPAWSFLNLNGLLYANEIWVPVSMDFLALVGIRQLEDTFDMLRDELGHEPCKRVIPTFFDGRTRKAAEVLAALEERYGSEVLPPVRTSVRVSEAPSHGQNIFDYAPGSSAAEDFDRLVEAIDARAPCQ
jgi:chromosome partitioning protein